MLPPKDPTGKMMFVQCTQALRVAKMTFDGTIAVETIPITEYRTFYPRDFNTFYNVQENVIYLHDYHKYPSLTLSLSRDGIDERADA